MKTYLRILILFIFFFNWGLFGKITANSLPKSIKSPFDFNLTYGDSSLSNCEQYYHKIVKEAENTETKVLSYIYLSDVYRYMWKLDSMHNYINLSDTLIVRHKIKNHFVKYEFYRAKSNQSFYKNDKSAYLVNINNAINIYKQHIKTPKYLWRLYEYKSNAFTYLDIFDSALVYVEKYWQLIPDSIRDTKRSPYFYKKAKIFEETGLLMKAQNEYQKAYETADIQKINLDNAALLKRLGSISHSLNDYTKALDYFLQSLRYYKTTLKAESDKTHYLYLQISQCYRNIGRIEKAKYYNQKLISLKDDLINDTYLFALFRHAKLYVESDSIQKAKYYFQLAYENKNYKTDKEKLNRAKFLIVYGKFKLEKLNDKNGVNEIHSSLKILKSLLKKQTPVDYDIYHSITSNYIIKNDYDSALHFCNLGLNAIFKNRDSNSNKLLGYDKLLKKASLLEQETNILFNLIKQVKKNELRKKHIRRLKSNINETHETLVVYRNQIKNASSKQFNTSVQKRYYQSLIRNSLLVFKSTQDSTYYYKAYQFAITNKAATLQDLTSESKARITGIIPDSLLRQEKDITEEIDAALYLINTEENKNTPNRLKLEDLRSKIFFLRSERDDLTSYFEKNYPDYFNLKYERELIDILSTQKKLNGHETYLEYFIGDKQLHTFVLTKNNFRIYTQEITDKFHLRIDSLYSYCSNTSLSKFDYSDFNTFTRSSSYLYDILIKPISKNLIKDKLIINPDDKLWYLPFEILLTDSATNIKNFRNLPYIIKDHPISYAYSTKLYFDKDENRSPNPRNVLTIVPSYDASINYIDELLEENAKRDQLRPLPNSIKEAEYVNKALGGKLLKGNDASEKNFKNLADKYKILHLAMHAVIDNNNPDYSKLIFTHGVDTTEDNYLNTYEIYNNRLNADLAVLSSCNSGSGKMQKGEGIISIARAFLYAGCPSLVTTLWSVDDASSAKLMQYFYENLKDGMSKSVALQQAKLKFIEKASPLQQHPYFWASYTQIGNNEPIKLKSKNEAYYLVAGIILLAIALFGKRLLKLFKRIEN